MSCTPSQQAVIDHPEGHAIVGAVAGSGKTYTMVRRVIRLIASGVDPRRILVLMFNKSAQEEFSRRLSKACREANLPMAEVQTFHGFGLRLCRRLIEAGLLPDAALRTEGYEIRKFARAVLQQVNEARSEDEQLDLNFDVLTEFLDTVDILKGELYPCADERWADFVKDVDQRFLQAFQIFEEQRCDNGVRHFSDLIYDPVFAALNDPAIARYIGGRYEHIIIDEFQDINEAQMTLVRMIAGDRAAVMAVGDDDQTIYRWRGAKPDYMTRLFCKEFPSATAYTLPHTFRYGHNLSLLANFVITRNENRTDKICVSGSDRHTDIDVLLVQSNPGAEVARCIKDWRKSGRCYAEVAVLVREYAHSISTEVALLQQRIPYRIVGAPPFFARAEVLGLRAYLQLAAGGFAHVADAERRAELIAALLTTPTLYLRRDVIEQIAEAGARNPDHFFAIAEQYFESDRRALPFTRDRRLRALATWRWVQSCGSDMSASKVLGEVMSRTSLQREIEKNVPDTRESQERVRMVLQILTLARERQESCIEFVGFLDQLASDYGTNDAGDDRVLITSVHRAKGLEWALVILPELTDGAFPSLRDGFNAAEVEDERRLFYVGTTRAIERLVLLAPPDQAFIKASRTGQSVAPEKPLASRFLYEANLSVAIEGLADTRNIQPDGRCADLIARYRHIQRGAAHPL